MKNILFAIVCFLTALIFYSCNQKGASLDKYYLVPDSTRVISLDDLPENNMLNYSDIYDNVRYIKLETIEESLIGYVSSLEVLPNGSFLITDFDNQKIFLFDKNGKFLNSIGSVGKGHQEYVRFRSVVYDKYKNEIIVSDHDVKTFKFYSIDGEYLRSVEIPWWIGSFQVLDEEHLVLSMNYWDKPKDEVGYNFRVIRKNGGVVYNGMEYSRNAIPANGADNFVLQLYNDTVLYKPCYSSVVYDFFDNNLKPRYFLDFGDKAIPTDWLGFFDKYELHKKLHNNSEYVICRSFAETDKSLVMNITENGIINICIVSKDDSDNIKYAASLFNDIYGLVSNTVVNSVVDNKIYSVIYSDQFLQQKSFIDKFSDEKGNEKEVLIKEIEEAFLSSPEEQIGQLKQIKKCIESSNFTISSEERDFINSFDGSENPIIQIATLKVN